VNVVADRPQRPFPKAKSLRSPEPCPATILRFLCFAPHATTNWLAATCRIQKYRGLWYGAWVLLCSGSGE